MSYCKADIKTIHRFLNATDGNWRNSIYVECKSCKHDKKEICGDFLLSFDADGKPIIIPLSDCKILFTGSIDPSECFGWISNLLFEEIFNFFLKNHANLPERGCRLMQAFDYINKL